MLKNSLIEIVKDLNDDVTSNPEYLRGQLEMAMHLLGFEDDGYYDKLRLMAEAFPASKLSDRKNVV